MAADWGIRHHSAYHHGLFCDTIREGEHTFIGMIASMPTSPQSLHTTPAGKKVFRESVGLDKITK